MKKILIIALTLIALAQANAQTPATTEAFSQTIISVKSSDNKETQTQATETKTNDATEVGAPDNSAKYVGTNDLNLYLLRQGVKRA